jgi:hypothetical protein
MRRVASAQQRAYWKRTAAAAAKKGGWSLLSKDEIVKRSLPYGGFSGIYFLIKDSRVVYVGQSTNVYARIDKHGTKDFDAYAYVPCRRENLDAMESRYIHLLRPPQNAVLKDGSMRAPSSVRSLSVRKEVASIPTESMQTALVKLREMIEDPSLEVLSELVTSYEV